MKGKNNIEPPVRKRTILALDTATKCGWALWSDGKLINSGVWNFGSKTTGRKLSTFAAQLFQIITKEQITEIVAEDIFLDKSKPKAFMSLGAMRGVLLSVVEYLDIPISFIEPQQHKRYLCRSSYATKADTQKALQRLGYGQIESNDEADAIAILLTYIQAPIQPIKKRIR
ncbi:MAG: crossover junction endodeoxyribonuclease RuvC [Bacteroidales bacterium]|nr:crossover junction endodeoxyribonuclease RuvC [Bacteroidales bacterium]MBD5235715.1 crossover junction endodeoxyribonuclease RuvC [Barnesiella sp.]